MLYTDMRFQTLQFHTDVQAMQALACIYWKAVLVHSAHVISAGQGLP